MNCVRCICPVALSITAESCQQVRNSTEALVYYKFLFLINSDTILLRVMIDAIKHNLDYPSVFVWSQIVGIIKVGL